MAGLRVLMLKTAGLLLALTAAAAAQDYPTKPVRVIVPFPPGAINDTVGRMIATQLERAPRQAVHRRQPQRRRRRDRHRARRQRAEGRLHAAGRLAGEHGQSLALQAVLRADKASRRSPWWPPRRTCCWCNPDLPVKSVQGADRLRQTEAGRGAICVGRRRQLPAPGRRAVQAEAGVDMCTCRSRAADRRSSTCWAATPRRSSPRTITALPQVRAGKLRALGVGGRERSPVFPDVPTIAEAGIPGYEAVNWIGIAAPAGTPPAIVATARGDRSDPGFARDVQAVRGRGTGDDAHELGRFRRLHGQGNGQMGARGEGGRHQGGVSGGRAGRVTSQMPSATGTMPTRSRS